MAFNFRDIAGYSGKNVHIYAYNPYDDSATPVTSGTDPKYLIRGAQSFEPNEEMSEDRVYEIGVEASKVIYGASEYSCSMSLLMRDLLQLARLGGVSGENKIYIADMNPINLVIHYLDPDSGDINFSRYVGGFKIRSSSESIAADGNTESTVEAGADMIFRVEGEIEVVQHSGDGTNDTFAIPVGTTEDDIIAVESPSGILTSAYSVVGTDVVFDADSIPETNSVVRIVHL